MYRRKFLECSGGLLTGGVICTTSVFNSPLSEQAKTLMQKIDEWKRANPRRISVKIYIGGDPNINNIYGWYGEIRGNMNTCLQWSKSNSITEENVLLELFNHYDCEPIYHYSTLSTHKPKQLIGVNI
jgi:hypothetical protein